MGLGISRVGDITDHGGIIVTGSGDSSCDGLPVARVGDIGYCPLPDHPSIFIILDGCGPGTTDGRPTARVGSACSCGATVVTGSGGGTVGS